MSDMGGVHKIGIGRLTGWTPVANFLRAVKGWVAIAALAVTVPGAEFAYAQAGHILFVAGEVKIVGIAGAERSGKKQETIAEGDTLLTSASASVQIKLADGSFLLVRPESGLRVDKFTLGGTGERGAAATLSLSKGAFRFSHPGGESASIPILQVITPLTTVTLTGNDYECMFVSAPPPADAAGLSPGLYVKTLARAASLTSGKQVVEVRLRQAWHVPDANSAPVLLDTVPEFQQRVIATATDPMPASGEGYRVGASADKSLEGAGAATAAHDLTMNSTSPGAPYNPAMQQLMNDRMNSFSNRLPNNINVITTIQQVPAIQQPPVVPRR